ncbi:MAG: rhomboid family intramembrane serine protease [Myxococcota bacterium]
MLNELCLLAAIVAGVSFVGHLRRSDPRQRGHTLMLAAVLLVSIVAALRVDRFWAVVSLSLVVLVVLVPWGLDLLVRTLFSRERLALAVRLAGWRAILMPGSGLAKQQVILRGLAVLERRGVDGALSYFRSLAHQTEDDGELRIIHEQIVSMLLFGQRWSEGIAHYEARFPPGYAAQRPPLALGLLRAYGESGKLGHAAGLLQAIEELLGRDPRAAGIVSQARLTFLAYAGESDPVASALTEERLRRLGLSAASGALFRGIALSRSGQADAATVELRRVASLATSRDDRVVYASRKAIDGMPEAMVDLTPELRTYAGRVADRLELFLRATPAMRRGGALWVTPILLVLLAAGYGALLVADAGGLGLLWLGAITPELWRAGYIGRILTGLWPQTDPIALLLSVYGVWLAGPLVERLHGRGRAVLVSVGGGAAGLAVACTLARDPGVVMGGSVLLTTGLVGAALSVLLSPRNTLPRRTRRILALPLVLLLLALAVMIPREAEGLDVSAVGMVTALLVGLLGVGLAPPQGRRAAILRGLGFLLVLAGVAAVGMVATEDPQAFAYGDRRPLRAEGVVLEVPSRFAVVTEADPEPVGPWPVFPGLHDQLAQRVGDRVQVLVTASPQEPDEPSALLRIDDALTRELVERAAPPPPRWQQAYREIAGDEALGALRSTVVRRNGDDLGVVIERPLPGGEVSVVLLAAPIDALEHDADLYAAVLADAHREPPTEP